MQSSYVMTPTILLTSKAKAYNKTGPNMTEFAFSFQEYLHSINIIFRKYFK